MNALESRKTFCGFVFLALLSIAVIILSLSLGTAHSDWQTEEGRFVLLQIRMPRVLLAFLIGMALSLAGASLQALLRNPLADPHLLGVSGGGALGVVIGSGFLISGALAFSIPFFSLLGSLAAVAVVYRLSLRKGVLSIYTLLLVGVMLNSFFVSIIVFLQSLVRSDELTTVLFWLLGNLSFTNYSRLAGVAIVLFIAAIPLFLLARRLNLISLGEAAAHSMGVPVETTKKQVYFLTALLTGMAVSVSGMIGFIGLVVPHLARLLFGSDYRKVLPASAWLGGIILVLSDLISRTLISPHEMPVGVITSFLGAPFFIFLLKKREGKRVVG